MKLEYLPAEVISIVGEHFVWSCGAGRLTWSFCHNKGNRSGGSEQQAFPYTGRQLLEHAQRSNSCPLPPVWNQRHLGEAWVSSLSWSAANTRTCELCELCESRLLNTITWSTSFGLAGEAVARARFEQDGWASWHPCTTQGWPPGCAGSFASKNDSGS